MGCHWKRTPWAQGLCLLCADGSFHGAWKVDSEKQRNFIFRLWDTFGVRVEVGLHSRVTTSVCGEGTCRLCAGTQRMPPLMGCCCPDHAFCLASCETQVIYLSSKLGPCGAVMHFLSAQQADPKCSNGFGGEFILSVQHLPYFPMDPVETFLSLDKCLRVLGALMGKMKHQ